MILTQRERYIAIGTASLLAATLVLWSLIHYVSARRDIMDQMVSKQQDEGKIQNIFDQQAKLDKEFKQMVNDGLKNSQADAKEQVRIALEQWAPSVGINEKTLNDGQVIHDADFDQISFKLSGWGTEATISKLLNQCETTTLPLRVTKVVINPVTEAKDYLYFELTVSTICQIEKPSRTRASADITSPRGDRL